MLKVCFWDIHLCTALKGKVGRTKSLARTCLQAVSFERQLYKLFLSIWEWYKLSYHLLISYRVVTIAAKALWEMVKQLLCGTSGRFRFLYGLKTTLRQ